MGGTLAALNDPSNLRTGQIIRQANDNGSGQSKEVRVTFKQRQLASDATDTKSCEAGAQMNYIEETFQVNNYRGVSFTMSEAQLRTFCDSFAELTQLTGSTDPNQIVTRANAIGAAGGALSVVREMFVDFQLSANALVQAMNQDLLASITGAAGNWYGGATNPTYIVENTDGSIYPLGLFQMKQNYMNTGDANSNLQVSSRKWDKELQAYRDARSQGIQPAGTSMKKVQEAVRISNETGMTKSDYLFLLAPVVEASWLPSCIIVVEGVFDALSVFQVAKLEFAGRLRVLVIALCGSEPYTPQVRFIGNIARSSIGLGDELACRVYSWLDPDKAGISGAIKLQHRLSMGYGVEVADIKSRVEPNDLSPFEIAGILNREIAI